MAVVVADVGTEVGGVIGVDRHVEPEIEHPLERMLAEIADYFQLEIRLGTDGQWDLLLDQTAHQVGVLKSPDAVIDPLGPECVQRTPDILGRALLAGMGDRPQPHRSGPGKDPGEVLRRMADLGGVEPDGDDLIEVGLGHGQSREGALLGQMAKEAENEIGVDAVGVVTPGASETADHRPEGHSSLGVGLRIEEHLGPGDAVGNGSLEVSGHEVGEVVFGPQHRRPLVEDVEERLEIGELVGRAGPPRRPDTATRSRCGPPVPASSQVRGCPRCGGEAPPSASR